MLDLAEQKRDAVLSLYYYGRSHATSTGVIKTYFYCLEMKFMICCVKARPYRLHGASNKLVRRTVDDQ